VVYLWSSMTAALEGGEWSAARPGRTLPSGKTRYPFYRSHGGPQGRSGRAENLVPTWIRSRTVQPVVQSLYRLRYPAHTLPLYIYLYTHTYVYNSAFVISIFTLIQNYVHILCEFYFFVISFFSLF